MLKIYLVELRGTRKISEFEYKRLDKIFEKDTPTKKQNLIIYLITKFIWL